MKKSNTLPKGIPDLSLAEVWSSVNTKPLALLFLDHCTDLLHMCICNACWILSTVSYWQHINSDYFWSRGRSHKEVLKSDWCKGWKNIPKIKRKKKSCVFSEWAYGSTDQSSGCLLLHNFPIKVHDDHLFRGDRYTVYNHVNVLKQQCHVRGHSSPPSIHFFHWKLLFWSKMKTDLLSVNILNIKV